MNSVKVDQIVKGNDPLLLNDPQVVWIVKNGSLVVHSTLLEDNQPKGNRRYLFTVSSGEALFGISFKTSDDSEQRRIMLAVALEETRLEKLTLNDLVKKIGEGDQDAIALLETWINHLGDWLGTKPLDEKIPLNPLIAKGSHYLSLLQGQGLISPYPDDQKVAWVSVRQGKTHWMGLENLSVESSSPPVPLSGNIWLEAGELVEVYTCNIAELENSEDIVGGLEILHYYFFEYFTYVEEQQIQAEFSRFQNRERLNKQMLEGSMSELAQVLDPQTVGGFTEGNDLLVAVGAIGRAMNISVRAPGKSEDLERVRDPLEAIARASQFRTRRVLLMGKWWKEEHGALLAYRGENQSPIALLPDSKNNYFVFDPRSQTKIPLNKDLLQEISNEAYMFYRPLPPYISNVLGVFSFGVKGHEGDLIAIFVLGIVGTLLGMVTPQATAILVNSAIPDSDQVLLFQLGLGLFAASLGEGGFQLAQSIMSLRVESSADANLQPAIWDRLLNLSPGFFRRYSSGDLVKRLLAVGQIRSQLSGATQRSLLSGIFALLNLILMFVYSIKLAWVGLSLSLMVVVVTIISGRLLVRKQREQEEIDGEINSLTVELINGVSKLRVAAAEERGFATWSKMYSKRMKLQSGIKRIDDSVTVFNDVLPIIGSILLFWYAILFIQMAIAKQNPTGLNPGTFLAFNAAFGIFIAGVTDLSNVLTDVLEIVPLWERAKPIVTSEPESDLTKADPGRLTGSIYLDHITFRYREDGPLILDDVSIEAKPGEFIALVGPSGSGKSTIFRLLLGFETPISGTIYYDSQDLAGLNIQAVRRQLGVVLQNVRIAASPIFDSIASGALITLDEAWEAARKSGFADDIEQMPMGMHTMISEGGTNLSGGQRQRLLIARALVSSPKIIIMDEATSALDNRTQAIVTESLDRMNATRIVIAHRLSTIRNADRIYVIEAGRVVQVGNFDQLVKQEGLFARLVARQLD